MKKTFYIPIIVALLTLAFATVSVLLYLRKNDARLIKYKLKIGKYLLLLNAMAVGAYAQDDFETTCYIGAFPRKNVFMGIDFGTNVTMINNFDYYPSAISPHVEPKLNNRNGFNLGLVYYHFLENIHSKHKLSVKLNYKTKKFDTKTEINSKEYKTSVINNTQSNLFDIIEYNSDWIAFSTDYHYQPILYYGLNFNIGFTLEQNLNSKFKESLEIEDETNQTSFMRKEEIKSISKDGKTAIIFNDFSDYNKIAVAFNTGVSYQINLNNIILSPYFEYNYYLTKVKYNNEWKNNSISIGIDLLFKIEI